MNPPTLTEQAPKTRGTEPEGPRLTLVEHLEELRRRLAICLATLVGASVLSLAFVDQLIEWLKWPAGGVLGRLAFFSPTEAVVAYLKVALAGGLVLAIPVILYHVWAFVRPGLSWRERYYGLAFVWWGSLLFVCGAAFAYWGLLPISLKFLLTFGSQHLEPVLSISRYLGFVLGVCLACGVVFELPLLVFMLTRLGIMTPDALRRRWSTALIVMLTVAALVTPTTDVINMTLMSIPMLLLYEASIIVSRWSTRTSRTVSL